jgi:tRNA (Thr-GGU) A37 N-methylase
MDINLKSIATIQSPFKSLQNMPVQPRGAKDTIATIYF